VRELNAKPSGIPFTGTDSRPRDKVEVVELERGPWGIAVDKHGGGNFRS